MSPEEPCADPFLSEEHRPPPGELKAPNVSDAGPWRWERAHLCAFLCAWWEPHRPNSRPPFQELASALLPGLTANSRGTERLPRPCQPPRAAPAKA